MGQISVEIYESPGSVLSGNQHKAIPRYKAMPVAHDEVKFARVETAGNWAVEIVIRDAVVRVGGDIDADHLTVILRAVRKA